MAELDQERFPQPEDFHWSEETTASITYDLTHDYLTVRFGEVRPSGYTPVSRDFVVGRIGGTREVTGMDIYDLELAVLKEHPELADDWWAIRPSVNYEKREDAATAAFAHRLQALARQFVEERAIAKRAADRAAAESSASPAD